MKENIISIYHHGGPRSNGTCGDCGAQAPVEEWVISIPSDWFGQVDEVVALCDECRRQYPEK